MPQERRTFQQLMLEAQQAAWPQAQQASLQPVAQLHAGMGQQHHQLAPQHAIEPVAVRQTRTAPPGPYRSPAAYPAHGDPSTAMPHSDARPGPVQLNSTTPPVTLTATPAVAAHAHAAAPPCAHACSTSHAGGQGSAPGLHQGGACLLQDGEAVRSGHAVMAPQARLGVGQTSTFAAWPSQPAVVASGPSLVPQSAGQAMLPCANRQLTARHCAGALAHGAGTGATVGPQVPTHSAGQMPRRGGGGTQAVQASDGYKADGGDVIVIASDDELVSTPAGGVPPTTRECQLAASTVSMPLRPSQHTVSITDACESDDDAPLVSRPRKVLRSSHRSVIHRAGSENVSQGNREACEVFTATSISDAVAKCKAHEIRVFKVDI